MQRFLRKTVFILVLALSIVLSSGQSVLAIGVSPAIIEVANLANNVEVKKTVNISRANPSKTEQMRVSVYGEGSQYVQLSSKTLELPKGQDSVPFDFFIKPVAAPNGMYSVEIAFNTIAPEADKAHAGGSAVSMTVGITGILKFEIIDRQVIDWGIANVYLRETEVGQPVVMYYTLENKGNVDARPDSIEYEIVDQSDSAHIFRGSLPKETFEAVPPSQTQTVNFAIREKLTQGQYNVKLTFLSEGKPIFISERNPLEVYAAGTLAQKAEVKSLKINGEVFEPSNLVRFDAVVSNVGAISIEPVMYVEIEKDGQPFEILRSDKKILLTTQETSFSASFKPAEKGEYKAKVFFEYGIYKTEPQEFTFKVAKLNIPLIIGIGVGVFLLLLLIILVAKKMKKSAQADVTPVQNNVAQAPVAPQPVPIAPSAPSNPLPPISPSPTNSNTPDPLDRIK